MEFRMHVPYIYIYIYIYIRKGDKKNCENYRGVSVINSIGTVLSRAT